MSNNDCLFCLDTHNTLRIVLTVDGSIVGLDAKLLETFNVETAHLQLGGVIETRNNNVDLSWLEGQISTVGPNPCSVSRKNGCLVKIAGVDEVVGVCYIKKKQQTRDNTYTLNGSIAPSNKLSWMCKVSIQFSFYQ